MRREISLFGSGQFRRLGDRRCQQLPVGISMTAGDMYVILGTGARTCSTTGVPATSTALYDPRGLAIDSTGDLFVADGGNNRVLEVASTKHTQWGQSLLANDAYTVAGSSNCVAGDSPNGTAGTSSGLNTPNAVSIDPGGDLEVADTGNNRVVELAAAAGTHWGLTMKAKDTYTIAGSVGGTAGSTGDGGSAHASLLDAPEGVSSDAAGTSTSPTRRTTAFRSWPTRRGHNTGFP